MLAAREVFVRFGGVSISQAVTKFSSFALIAVNKLDISTVEVPNH